MNAPARSHATPSTEAEAESAIQLETFLPYRLSILATSVSQALARVYGAKFGITIPEWRVLATLGQFNEITAREIGLHSHMHKTTVSRAVAALEKRGLVERRPNRDDLREAFLTMSATGLSIYRQVAPLARDFADALACELSVDERELLDRLITRLIGRVKHLGGEPAMMDQA